MNSIYTTWIAAYIERMNGKLLGRCETASKEMQTAFPELRLVRGYVLVFGWGQRGHWWLEAPDGTVVDPTVGQFPEGRVLDYDEWLPGHPVCVGKCMECGEQIWREVDSLDDVRPQRFCDDICTRAFASELTGGS